MTITPASGSASSGTRTQNRQALYLAVAIVELVLLLLLGLLLFRSGLEAKRAKTSLAETRGRLDQQDKDLAAAKVAVAGLEDQLQSVSMRLEAGQKQLRTLELDRAAAIKHRDALEQEMRQALQSKDIAISELQGKLTVNIMDRIMFSSGEAVIKAEGEPVLRKLAGVLKQYPNRRILVVGHTDNVPIRSAAMRSKYPTNWELSTARATAAVRFLVEKTGFDARRIGAVGYGDQQPVADNNTVEGRARNRRISITIMEEDRLVEPEAASGAARGEAMPKAPAAVPPRPHVP